MCQRLEVPRKTTVCHLKCFTLWVEGFKEEYFRHKHHRACRPCDSQCFCLPGSAESIFCWERPSLLPPQLFSKSMTVERPRWFNSQKKAFLSFPGSTPRRQNSQGSWGQHCQHTCHRAAPPASLPHRGRAGRLPQPSTVSVSPANNFVQTDPKLRGPTWSLGGHRQLPANKASAWHTTFGMTRFLVQNLKRKRKVLALGVKSQSCYLTLA